MHTTGNHVHNLLVTSSHEMIAILYTSAPQHPILGLQIEGKEGSRDFFFFFLKEQADLRHHARVQITPKESQVHGAFM